MIVLRMKLHSTSNLVSVVSFSPKTPAAAFREQQAVCHCRSGPSLVLIDLTVGVIACSTVLSKRWLSPLWVLMSFFLTSMPCLNQEQSFRGKKKGRNQLCGTVHSHMKNTRTCTCKLLRAALNPGFFCCGNLTAVRFA